VMDKSRRRFTLNMDVALSLRVDGLSLADSKSGNATAGSDTSTPRPNSRSCPG
jgi:hypothetical protein